MNVGKEVRKSGTQLRCNVEGGAAVRLMSVLVTFAFCSPTYSVAFSPSCALGIKSCVTIQGAAMPVDSAEHIIEACRDFTRRNIGARVLRMSLADIHRLAGDNLHNPMLRASLAYDYLHDSGLKFDRSAPIESRYQPVKRACGQAFRDMRVPLPEDE